jgi:hypothetical protein
MRQYVEDSTKGKAMVNPRTYKKDSLVQVWVDSRKLAMLSRWFDDGGRSTRFLSDVVKFTIDLVIDSLLSEGKIDRVEFTSDAREMLERKYRVNLNPSGRGDRNVIHNLTLDERRREQMEKGDGLRPSIDGRAERVAALTERALKTLERETGVKERTTVDYTRYKDKDDSPIHPMSQVVEEATGSLPKGMLEDVTVPDDVPITLRKKSVEELDDEQRERDEKEREYQRQLAAMNDEV